MDFLIGKDFDKPVTKDGFLGFIVVVVYFLINKTPNKPVKK